MKGAEHLEFKSCCSTCHWRRRVWNVIKWKCAVARLHPTAPWQEWLASADQPNECGKYEPREEKEN